MFQYNIQVSRKLLCREINVKCEIRRNDSSLTSVLRFIHADVKTAFVASRSRNTARRVKLKDITLCSFRIAVNRFTGDVTLNNKVQSTLRLGAQSY